MRRRTPAIAILLAAASLEAQAALTADPQAAHALSRSDLMEWTMALGLVIFLILVSAWLLRRFNRLSISHGNRLRILGGIPVGTRERVVLLQVGERQLLLGVAPGRVETLHVLEPGELARAECGNSADPAPVTFAGRLTQAMRGV
ncbi:MAG: flagellar biosynthetic protein FliO [Methylococcaceae bacterium]|nr:flagellar biosynthetic protein FliO [Methylococcaceae bacterium]MCI0733580.1 flagellar biosynthetic protein FliO [Methylococcaceae bacterium]